MAFPKSVIIREVVTRDGWQIFPKFIPTETKIEIIKKIIDNGAKQLDVVSFPRPDIVPQFADAEAVLMGVKDYAAERGVKLYVGGLNKKGTQRALAAGAKIVVIGLSLSDEHSRRNVGKSLQDAIREAYEQLETYKNMPGINIHVMLPCFFGSSYGDEIDLDIVKSVLTHFVENGVKDFNLADTAGISDPEHTRAMLRLAKSIVPVEYLSCHFHNTRGMGLANAYVALEEGISILDAALGEMGGCPFVPNVKGNIATEDLMNMCLSMGIDCGQDLDKTVALSLEIGKKIGHKMTSCMADLYSNKCSDT